MTYSEQGDRISLEMTRDDFEEILMMTGFAAGAARDPTHFWMWMKLANRMNATNPRFVQYEIPKEFQ